MIELEWLRFAKDTKEKGRRKTDKSSNEKIKIKRINYDIILESEQYFYRINILKIISAITKVMIEETDKEEV